MELLNRSRYASTIFTSSFFYDHRHLPGLVVPVLFSPVVFVPELFSPVARPQCPQWRLSFFNGLRLNPPPSSVGDLLEAHSSLLTWSFFSGLFCRQRVASVLVCSAKC